MDDFMKDRVPIWLFAKDDKITKRKKSYWRVLADTFPADTRDPCQTVIRFLKTKMKTISNSCRSPLVRMEMKRQNISNCNLHELSHTNGIRKDTGEIVP